MVSEKIEGSLVTEFIENEFYQSYTGLRLFRMRGVPAQCLPVSRWISREWMLKCGQGAGLMVCSQVGSSLP